MDSTDEHELGEGLSFSREDEPTGVPLRFVPNPYEHEEVGPSGETRAAMRVKLFERLEEMRSEVKDALISDSQAAKLQLEIHREQCALLGLPVPNGRPF